MEQNLRDDIAIGFLNREVYIKTKGHITAKHAFIIRELIHKTFLHQKHQIKVFFDLSSTEYMDSTFLGMMLAIDKKFSRHKHIDSIIINPCEKALIILIRSHLINFLSVESIPIPANVLLNRIDENIKISDYEKLKILYDTHDKLSSVDPEHKPDYEIVKDIIKKEISKKRVRKKYNRKKKK
jgi:anti-sigma B factor antagonist